MSEGELQAAEKLTQAARLYPLEPAALQLRLYQTLVEVSGEANSTIVMPVPIELLTGSGNMGQTLAQAATALAASQAEQLRWRTTSGDRLAQARAGERQEVVRLFCALRVSRAASADWRRARRADGRAGARRRTAAPEARDKYARRAAFRATPHGLWAGVGIGSLGEATRAATGPMRAEVTCRLTSGADIARERALFRRRRACAWRRHWCATSTRRCGLRVRRRERGRAAAGVGRGRARARARRRTPVDRVAGARRRRRGRR